MECPKCGYERKQSDTDCPLCGINYEYFDNLQAEKVSLKQKTKEQQGAIKEPEPTKDDSYKTSVREQVSGKCPKCEYPRLAGAVECSNCGVIYQNYEDFLKKQKAEEKAKKEEEEKRFAEEKARIQKEAEKAITQERLKREKTIEEVTIKKKDAEDVRKKKAKEKEALKREKKEKKSAQKQSLLESETTAPSANFFVKNKIVSIILIVLLAGGLVFSYKLYSDYASQKKYIAEQEALKQKLAEERKKIADEFLVNKESIIPYLKSLIDQRNFGFYNKEIKKYEIPAIEKYLVPVKKYLDEIKLYDSAQEIPAGEYKKNYNIYVKLTQMNPGSKLYKKKRSYYRIKLANKKYREASAYFKKKKHKRSEIEAAVASINEAVKLNKKSRKYRSLQRKLAKEELLFFNGNDNVQMAVRDDGITKGATGGQRKLYVWIKNVGSSPFYVNPDYFTMVGTNRKKYSYNNCSKKLVKNLQPGEKAKGHIYFYTKARPKELIFNHNSAGKISRLFP